MSAPRHQPVLASGLAALLWLLATAGGAEPLPLFLVPADDGVLASMVLAADGTRHPVILFDPHDQELIAAYTASWDGPVRCFHRASAPAAVVELMTATAGGRCTVVSDLLAFARTLWPQAPVAIAVAAADYPGLLVAAAFAGATGSALLPVDDSPAQAPRLQGWTVDRIFLMPTAAGWKTAASAMAREVVEATTDRLLAELGRVRGTPQALVVANPNDRSGYFSPAGVSLLAPLLSAVHGAPLVLVDSADPAAIEAKTLAWLDQQRLAVTHVILAGDELALRSHRVPDPVRAAGGAEARGGGTEIRVELFSQIQHDQPQDLAVGRIVGESASQASVALARQLHRRARSPQRPVVFLSNADEVFALGETISRATANDVRNLGLTIEAYYRGHITPAVIRRALKRTDLLVWEGHPRDLTLEESGGIAVDRTPQLVVLQGCYTLDRSDPFILLEKGTEAIVATSAAIYSASGSAFARSFVDAILYDGADLGTAVRNARNFLLALAQLKRARHHPDWRKTYRAALAFALWGDPVATAPVQPGRPARPPVQWSRSDDRLTLSIPSGPLREASVGRYQARTVPRMMLGGLLVRTSGDGTRTLKDLYVTTQPVAAARVACAPGPGWEVVSLYAPRTQTLTVLARPDWKRLAVPPHGSFTFALAAPGGECRAASDQPSVRGVPAPRRTRLGRTD